MERPFGVWILEGGDEAAGGHVPDVDVGFGVCRVGRRGGEECATGAERDTVDRLIGRVAQGLDEGSGCFPDVDVAVAVGGGRIFIGGERDTVDALTVWVGRGRGQ